MGIVSSTSINVVDESDSQSLPRCLEKRLLVPADGFCRTVVVIVLLVVLLISNRFILWKYILNIHPT